MKFLLDIFKKSPKGDAFRAIDNPNTYNDGIAKLNSLGDNQYAKLTTQKMNSISKNKTNSQQTITGNTIIPGTR
jgi:hypothetical protein